MIKQHLWCISGQNVKWLLDSFLQIYWQVCVIALILQVITSSWGYTITTQTLSPYLLFRKDVDLCVPSLLCLPSDHELHQHPVRRRACDQAKLTNSSHTNKSLSNTKNALPSHREDQDTRWGPGDQAGPESDNIEKLWNVCGEERKSVAEVILQEVYSTDQKLSNTDFLIWNCIMYM